MSDRLYAGAARRIINAQPGSPKFGLRLFGEPIQGYESDLTATALVLANSQTKLAIIALDLIVFFNPLANQVRQEVAETLGIPRSHVMINISHDHSTPVQLSYRAVSPESKYYAEIYEKELRGHILAAVEEASQSLQPARIGAGRGEAKIGIYRRETGPDGRDVLGEVPERDIDHSVGVVRIDNLEGQPVAILFSYGCHPVTVGPRCQLGSPDFPGAAREIIEQALASGPAQGGDKSFLRAVPAVELGTRVRALRQQAHVMLDAAERMAGLRKIDREWDVARHSESVCAGHPHYPGKVLGRDLVIQLYLEKALASMPQRIDQFSKFGIVFRG